MEKEKKKRVRHGDPRKTRTAKIQIWLSEDEDKAFRAAAAHFGGMAKAIAFLGEAWPALDEETRARLLAKGERCQKN